MDCPICGHRLEAHESFCSNCGHYALPLQDDSRQVPVIAPPPDTPADGGTVVSPCPNIPEKKSGAQPQKKVAERLYPPPEADNGAESAPPNTSAPVQAPPASPMTKPPKTTEPPRPPEPAPAAASAPPAAPKALRRLKILAVCLACLAVASIAMTAYVIVTTSSLRVQLNKAQKEGLTAQAAADELEIQVSELTESLNTAKTENTVLNQQISDLTAQVGNLETSINQNQYDKEAAERNLEEAKNSLAEAQEANSALESELTETKDSLTAAQEELETAREENESLTAQIGSYEDEISFYDSYVVFVMLSSSEKYYHKYDCSQFTQRNFLAYSTKLAEANGYSPCPECIGSGD